MRELVRPPHGGAPDVVSAGVDARFSARDAAAVIFETVSIHGWNPLPANLRAPAVDHATSLRRSAVGRA
jgi:hypothetical protein